MVFSAIGLLAILFESPLLALGTAAGAAAVPIIIHLLNRKRFRVVHWAAMRFLLAAQRKNTRRMRLEQLILLLVRTAIALLLVLAMASVMPWAEELWFKLFPASAAQAATGGRRTHKILVLDGSFSMGTKVGDTTCFERARALAGRILQQASPGDGFSVVLMSAPARRVVPEPSDDANKVWAEVQNLRLPHGNADLGGTLHAVEDMLRRSPAKFEEREVYFLTDLQRSTWTSHQGDPGATLGKIQARGRMIFLDVGQDGVPNTAVTAFGLGVPFVISGATTPLTATVHHYGATPRKSVRVQLLAGRARATANDPGFGLRVVSQTTVDLQPGSNTINFPYRFAAPGEYAVQLHVEGDALEVDDTRSAVVTVKDNVPVMLVNGKPAAELYDRATEWLADALNPFAGGAPRNVPARPKVVTEAQFADAALGDLTPYDCVFLCDVARLGAPEIRRLENHLHRGGGVVFTLGPRVDLEAYNRLAYRNGDSILPARLLAVQKAPERRFFNFFADEKAYHEPPLDAFAGDRDRAGLLAARFRQYVRTDLAGRGRARKVLSFMPEVTASAAEARDNTALPAGDAALIDWPRHRGRVLLFTSTVNTDWTTWPISPSFPALMQEVLHHAVAGRLREQAALVGEPLEEFLPSGTADLEVALQLPSGRTETLRTEARDEAGLLRWPDTDESGIYRAGIGQHPQDHLFAVNVPVASDVQQSSESDLARTNQAELQSAYPGWEFQIVTDLSAVSHAGGPTTEVTVDRPLRGMGMVIARWLLLAMLALVAVEVVLAWKFGHYTAVPGAGEPPATGRLLPGAVGASAAVLFLMLAGVLAHAAWTGDLFGFLPDHVRTGIEARLAVPPPAAGEGTRWHAEFTPYLKDAAADPWLAGGLGLGLAVMVILVYLREGATAGKAYKLLLGGLRLFLIFLLLAVLLPQIRLLFEREGWPDVALLIDDSRSMSATDAYQDPAVQAAAERLALDAQLTNPERLQLAQTLLTHKDHGWLETMLSRRRVKVHIYHCSTRAARIADLTEPHDLEPATAAVQGLRPEGESSQLGTAVRQVLNDFRGSSLTALVMLTDGVTTEGEDLARASRYAAQVGVPLYFVGVGDAHDVKDLKLHDLVVEDSVFVNDTLVFEARLTAQGYSSPRTVPVRLYERDKDGKLTELARESVTTDAQGKPVKFRIKYKPTEPGERTFILDVPEQPDEVKPATNNRLERVVFVRESKRIRVLYVEGYPRYDFRYVKHLFERESDRDPKNKSLELKVLLLDADSEYAAEDKSALADFPTREELFAYDVVIFGDVDPKDARIGDRNLQHLADFVRERGGGFLMIAGGQQFSPYTYRNTPLQDVLPVTIPQRLPPEHEFTVPFRPELTPAGRFHPIFRFSPDEAENTAIWNGLPEIYWFAEGLDLKPAAEVLLVQPKAPGPGSRGEGGYPLLVQQFVGAGRCMFMGFDETWSWRLRENELRFNQFWIQLVRHLARTRQGRIELRVDRETPYRRGEPIKLTVRFPDDAPPPGLETKVEVVSSRTAPRRSGSPGATEKETIRLAKLEGSRATYEGLITRTPEGDYRFWLAAPNVPDPKPRAEAVVLPPPGEMELLRMNQAEMEHAADETHGKFYTLADADRLVDDLPAGTRIALSTPMPPTLLWNTPAVFALALGLLGAEWVLRKRKHLL